MLRAAPCTGTSGEYDGIAADDRLRNVVLARVLEIDYSGFGAGSSDIVGVSGVADQGDDPVTAPRQDGGQAHGDLAVAPGDGYSHGPEPTSIVAPS